VRGGARGRVARGEPAGREGSISIWGVRVSREGFYFPAITVVRLKNIDKS
jgi:hypothetical protein